MSVVWRGALYLSGGPGLIVYVVLWKVEYEGSEVLDVFYKKEDAIKLAKARMEARDNWDKMSQRYVVKPFEVK